MSAELRWQLRIILCRLGMHDWDYFSLTNLDGSPAHFRCCMRCEKSETLEVSNG